MWDGIERRVNNYPSGSPAPKKEWDGIDLRVNNWFPMEISKYKRVGKTLIKEFDYSFLMTKKNIINANEIEF
jgi:hypothetical protein